MCETYVGIVSGFWPLSGMCCSVASSPSAASVEKPKLFIKWSHVERVGPGILVELEFLRHAVKRGVECHELA